VLIGPDSRILFIGYPGLPLQTALNNLFAEQKSQAPKVIIGGDTPNIQPGSRPNTAPAASDEAPALRDMPDNF
jgi:hypothetical protein